MRTSCISWPERERLIVIRQSQLPLCDGNHCAAALLSFFEHGHNYKLEQREQAEHANRVARQHGEEAKQDTSLLQYHNEDGLEKGLLGLYGRKTIRAALDILVQKGFVSIHKNPNPRYHFDKTHYFLFHPEAVTSQLIDITDQAKMPCRCEIDTDAIIDSLAPDFETENSQVFDICDEVKEPHRDGISAASSGKNTSSSGKNAATRTEITDRDLNPPPLPPRGAKKQKFVQEAQELLTYFNTVHSRGFQNSDQIRTLLISGISVDECKMVIDWLFQYVRIHQPEAYEKFADNVIPFRPKNFDRNRERALTWLQRGGTTMVSNNRPYIG